MKLLRLVVGVFTLVQLGLSEDVKFNRNTMGVVFTPNVAAQQDFQYELDHFVTMMKVMSERFSNIAVVDATLGFEESAHSRNLKNLSANAAALLNKRAAAAGISSWIQLQVDLDARVFANKSMSVLELGYIENATKHANLIYPNTVTRIVLTFAAGDYHDDENFATRLADVQALKAISNKTTLNVQLGVRLDCETLSIVQNENDKESFIKEFDFVVCHVEPEGDRFNFSKVFLPYKHQINNISKDIPVMGHVQWFTGATMDNQMEVEKMKLFWKQADEWAHTNSFNLLMIEGVDNPHKTQHSKSLGWWTLVNDTMIGDVAGYIEKVAQSSLTTTTNTTTHKPQATTPAITPTTMLPVSTKPQIKSGKNDATTIAFNMLIIYMTPFASTIF